MAKIKTAKKAAKPAAGKVAKPSAMPLKKAASKPKAPVKKVVKPVAAKVQKKAASKNIASKSVAKSAPKAVIKASIKPKVVKPAPVKKTLPKPALSKSSKTRVKDSSSNGRVLAQQFIKKPATNKNLKLTPFLLKQRQRLLELKDTLLDSMSGVARGNLHAGSETSAFGMHQADAGSDAYDRDFALSMLSKEQGSLYEIDEALKRIEDGSYGMCEICEKPIRHDRLEALPFTRFTVECQAELEKRQHHHSVRPHINSLFGLTEEEVESEEEETTEVS